VEIHRSTEGNVEEPKELFSQRRKKAEELKREGIPLYPNTFRVNHSIEEILSSYGSWSEEDLHALQENFALAGRR
jgi:lysyl-tRNA synthetase class 2